MRKILLVLSLCLSIGFAKAQEIASPNGDFILSFKLDASGTPTYGVRFKNKDVIKESKMGFVLKHLPPMNKDFVIADVQYDSKDTTWTPVWGENKEIRDNHKEMFVSLVQKESQRKIDTSFPCKSN